MSFESFKNRLLGRHAYIIRDVQNPYKLDICVFKTRWSKQSFYSGTFEKIGSFESHPTEAIRVLIDMFAYKGVRSRVVLSTDFD